jgi:uncharacterized membrane protein
MAAAREGFHVHSFELRPNSSLSPRAALWFYGSLVTVSMGIAIGCAMAGAWLVLPFAGLELAVLWFVVSLVYRRTAAREFIRVDEREVVVEKRLASTAEVPTGRLLDSWRFPRPWTRIELCAARVAHWPTRLVFSARGESVEVGAFLTDGERRGLKKRLAEILGAGH